MTFHASLSAHSPERLLDLPARHASNEDFEPLSSFQPIVLLEFALPILIVHNEIIWLFLLISPSTNNLRSSPFHSSSGCVISSCFLGYGIAGVYPIGVHIDGSGKV